MKKKKKLKSTKIQTIFKSLVFIIVTIALPFKMHFMNRHFTYCFLIYALLEESIILSLAMIHKKVQTCTRPPLHRTYFIPTTHLTDLFSPAWGRCKGFVPPPWSYDMPPTQLYLSFHIKYKFYCSLIMYIKDHVQYRWTIQLGKMEINTMYLNKK